MEAHTSLLVRFHDMMKNSIFRFFMKIQKFRSQMVSAVKINQTIEIFIEKYVDLWYQIVSGRGVTPEIEGWKIENFDFFSRKSKKIDIRWRQRSKSIKPLNFSWKITSVYNIKSFLGEVWLQFGREGGECFAPNSMVLLILTAAFI